MISALKGDTSRLQSPLYPVIAIERGNRSIHYFSAQSLRGREFVSYGHGKLFSTQSLRAQRGNLGFICEQEKYTFRYFYKKYKGEIASSAKSHCLLAKTEEGVPLRGHIALNKPAFMIFLYCHCETVNLFHTAAAITFILSVPNYKKTTF